MVSGGCAIRALLIALLYVWCLCADAGGVQRVHGQVVAVADGDTLVLLDGDGVRHVIRLLAIDAPEGAQPYGDASTQSLRELTAGGQAVALCVDMDRYARRVCQVFVAGVDVGLQQIDRGMAWHFVRHARPQTATDRQIYQAAEATARAARRGLWKARGAPVPPWIWRSYTGGQGLGR